jgi:hypothetical protein
VKEVRVVEAPQCEACFVAPNSAPTDMSKHMSSTMSSDARVLPRVSR